jgi:hypothetical protein
MLLQSRGRGKVSADPDQETASVREEDERVPERSKQEIDGRRRLAAKLLCCQPAAPHAVANHLAAASSRVRLGLARSHSVSLPGRWGPLFLPGRRWVEKT